MTDMLNTVNAAIMGDRDGFQQGFNSLISAKVNDALEIKKIEVASQLLNPNIETSNEFEKTQTEFDGSDAADGNEASS